MIFFGIKFCSHLYPFDSYLKISFNQRYFEYNFFFNSIKIKKNKWSFAGRLLLFFFFFVTVIFLEIVQIFSRFLKYLCLAKVLEINSIRVHPNHSWICFRNFANHSEQMWENFPSLGSRKLVWYQSYLI